MQKASQKGDPQQAIEQKQKEKDKDTQNDKKKQKQKNNQLFLSSQQSQQQKDQPGQVVCPQYLLITPCDMKNWGCLKKQLQQLTDKQYTKDKFIKFIQSRYKDKNYANVRLLLRIKTEYFWNGVTNFMLKCMIQDSQLLSNAVNILVYGKNTIVKLTKYQIFLILSHMFIGTMPDQLYSRIPTSWKSTIPIPTEKYKSFELIQLYDNPKSQQFYSDSHLGRILCVMDDQDDITCSETIEFRLNKLKALIRYFCLFYKRSEENSKIREEVVAFQRHHIDQQQQTIIRGNQAWTKITDDNIKLCKAQPQVGQFYSNQNCLNKISLNNSKLIYNTQNPNTLTNSQILTFPHPNGSRYTKNPLPGYNLYTNDNDVEEKIFLCHPEMWILHLLAHEGLGLYQAIVVYGAEKYAAIGAVSKYVQFDFRMKYRDQAEINSSTKMRRTTYVFVNRSIYWPKGQNNILGEIVKASTGLIAVSKLKSAKNVVVSGKFHTPHSSISQKPQKNKSSQPEPTKRLNIQLPWDVKFLIDWVATSVAGFETLEYFVQSPIQAIQIRIMARELKDYTVKDIISIIQDYYKFRVGRVRLSFIQFVKNFVV